MESGRKYIQKRFSTTYIKRLKKTANVVATLDDNTKVNIEMQVKGHENTIDRSVFYETGLFHESLNSGEDYLEIPKVISIWITDYDVFDEGPFHERARLKRKIMNNNKRN